jgi:two-component system chemotaxis response regulator CheY
MRVLIAEDDKATRLVMKRILEREFGCVVTEADNGLDALDCVSKVTYAFLVLDVQMPMMDGIEVLQTLRQSAEHAALPVVMLTGELDETLVKRIIQLGISAYLAKPLDPEALIERLSKVVRNLGEAGRVPGGQLAMRATQGEVPLPVMIVEGDHAFRKFFVSNIEKRFPVLEAVSGAQALKMCFDQWPQVIFVGRELGAVSCPLFVKKLRALEHLTGTRVIAIAPKSSLSDVEREADYDGVMFRTFVPQILMDQFERLRTGAPRSQKDVA